MSPATGAGLRETASSKPFKDAIEKSLYISGDLADPGVCEQMVEMTVDRFGSIDILVNNAGIIRRAPAIEFSLADWNEILAVNLTAVFRLSQLAAET